MTQKDIIYDALLIGETDSGELSERLGMSVATVSSYLSELRLEGRVEVIKTRKNDSGRGVNFNIYRVIYIA